ncbi:hypothetical protein C5688_06080 [Methylocystis sp. MitZ-2018]|nr:hypothetical protein C5688_06080 [Methylocystis sp. MitZ-2018]
MAKSFEKYLLVDVESYIPDKKGGLHGKIHLRPCPGQGFATTMHVECSKKLSNDYPVGTKFRIKAKLTDREGAGEFLYSYHGWNYEVIP